MKLPHVVTSKQAVLTTMCTFKSIIFQRMCRLMKPPPPPVPNPPTPKLPPPYIPPFPNGIYYDGSSLGAGKDAGAGAVLYINGIEIDALCIHFIGSNNEAEYRGFSLALDLAEKHNISHPNIYGDSDLVTKQILGKYRVHKRHLRALRNGIAARRDHILFHPHWISRKKNSRADQICFAAMISKELGESFCSPQNSTVRPPSTPPSPPPPPSLPPPPPAPNSFILEGSPIHTIKPFSGPTPPPHPAPQFPIPAISFLTAYPGLARIITANTPTPFPDYIVKKDLTLTIHSKSLDSTFPTRLSFIELPLPPPTVSPFSSILSNMRDLIPKPIRSGPSQCDPLFSITLPALDSSEMASRKAVNPKPSFIPPPPLKHSLQKNKIPKYFLKKLIDLPP
jgi:ribonuclease HI